jgi:hypothetical protein
MNKFFRIENRLFIINHKYSKIGYSYPRLFIEEPDLEYDINFDITLNAEFKMMKSDFKDWIEDSSEILDEDLIRNELNDIHINYDILKDIMMKKGL